METLPSGVKIREFYSPRETRDEIFRRVKEGYEKRFPIENDKVRIELVGADYDKNKTKISLDDELKAVLTGGRLSVPLRGTVRLIDKATNRPIDEKHVTLASVPYMNDDGLFVMGGTQYVVSNQSRLKPGIYARTKDNGELESHCFHHTVNVWTENGLIPIGKIVNKRMRLRVWSYDFEKKEFVLRPITAWYKNKVKGLGCANFEKYGSLPSLFKTHPKTLWATPTHKVFSACGTKTEIQEARELTFVEEAMTSSQEQMVWGSLLGDAHVTPQGLYQEAHCKAQAEYMELKGRILSPFHNGLKTRPPRNYDPKKPNKKKSEGSVWLSTKACAFFQKLRSELYLNGEKVVTREWLNKLDERALAFWFCDDGSAAKVRNQHCQTNHVSINLATQGFSTTSVETLRTWLKERWGVETKKDRQHIYDDKDFGWFLLIGGESSEKFLDLIAPFIHPTMAYKIPGRPVTSTCRTCPKELNRIQKFCNTCTVCRFLGNWRLKPTKLGSSAEVRAMAVSKSIPPDNNPGLRWDMRMVSLGTGLSAMETDTAPRLSLVTGPCDYQTDRGFVLEGTKTAFDIEVEGTHNYFANGVLVSNCNVAPGTGASMRLNMEPETGVFRTTIDKSSIKLYPVLKALGVPDEKLRQSWGDEILKKNQDAYDRNAFGKFYDKLLRNRAVPDATDDEKKSQVLERLAASRFDPEVNSRTLGKPYDSLSTDVLSDASAKLLHISRGEQEEDDRDHPANRTFHSVDDFMADRVRLDAGKLGRTLLYRATYDKSLKHLSPGYFTPQLEKLIVSNQLSQVVPGLNPMEIYDQHNRVIQLGEGGVPGFCMDGDDAKPASTKAPYPRQFSGCAMKLRRKWRSCRIHFALAST
jgi:hypothetical protein